MSVSSLAIESPGRNIAQWSLHLGALAALFAVILIGFRYEAVNAVEVWWIYETYTHCFLVIPISLWLIWENREDLLAETPSVTAWGLLPIPFLLVFWLVANIATINEARQVAVVGLMQAAILTMVGFRVYRKILFPALYLFALVPAGQYLIPPMQTIAATFTDFGLTLLGVPHYMEGTLISLETGQFEIAEACAGLRFLIATFVLGLLFAHLTYRSWWKTGLFLVASIIVPLIGNGFRCLGIIMLAYMTNNELATGADHIVYGWFFNVAILLILFWAGLKFRDPEQLPEPVAVKRRSPPAARNVAVTAAVAALAISAGPAAAYFRETRPIQFNEEVLSRPLVLPGWQTLPGSDDWHPQYVNPDAEFAVTLAPETSPDARVDLAVEYYARLRPGRALVSTTNYPWQNERWRRVGFGAASARIDGTDVSFGESVIVSPTGRRLVWASYWLDGRFTRSGMAIKLLQIKTALSGNEAAALVALSTPIDGAVDEARQRLRDAVAALGELPRRLAETGQSGNIVSASR